MADDGSININTKVDTRGLDKGLNDVNKKVGQTQKTINSGSKSVDKFNTVLNEASGSAGGFASKLQNIASSGGVTVAAITAAITATKAYAKAIKNTAEAYKVQEKAETALTTAAMNNPYIDGEAIDGLKDFASQLQANSDIGDEVTLRYEAQLVAAGRTQEQIQDILQASADIAASGAMSFESAVRNLSKTYGGLSGELGESIPQIKELTFEQLKNGEAVKVVASQYSGFAKKLKDSSIAAQNVAGDFKEAIGELTKPTVEKWDNFWSGFYTKGTEAVKWLNQKLSNLNKDLHEHEYLNDINAVYINKETGKETSGAKYKSTEWLNEMQTYLEEKEAKKALNSEEQTALLLINEELRVRKNIAAEEKKQAGAGSGTSSTDAKTADDYEAESNTALQENIKSLEVEAKAKGESVDAQDLYNVYLQSYIDLLTKTEGKIQEGYPVEQKRLQQLKEAKTALMEAATAEEKLQSAMNATVAATETINAIKQQAASSEEIENGIAAIEKQKEAINALSDAEIAEAQQNQEYQLSKEELLQGLTDAEKQLVTSKVDAVTATEQSGYDKYATQQQELLDLKKAVNDSEILSEEEKNAELEKLDAQYAQNKKQQLADIMSTVKSYTDQTVQVMSDAADLMLQISQNESSAELAELEAKYLKGEMSEEEYNDAVTEAKKDAAKEQYKIQMFQWSANILQAVANTALGITQALATEGPLGIITGALVSAAGAVQLASIIASKPVPPSFAAGGIVQGNSYSGDNVSANVNSGEMILNAAQQKALWTTANGGNSSSGNNIVINNSASNIVSATPQIDKNKIAIMIDARVNDSLRNGRYDKSLNMANQGMSGDFYGI